MPTNNPPAIDKLKMPGRNQGLDGLFIAASGDRTVKFFMALIVVVTLADMGIKRYRGVRPTPQQTI